MFKGYLTGSNRGYVDTRLAEASGCGSGAMAPPDGCFVFADVVQYGPGEFASF